MVVFIQFLKPVSLAVLVGLVALNWLSVLHAVTLAVLALFVLLANTRVV